MSECEVTQTAVGPWCWPHHRGAAECELHARIAELETKLADERGWKEAHQDERCRLVSEIAEKERDELRIRIAELTEERDVLNKRCGDNENRITILNKILRETMPLPMELTMHWLHRLEYLQSRVREALGEKP